MEETSIAKRTRGRPRKNEDVHVSNGDDEKNARKDLNNNNNNESNNNNYGPAKRTRGRPPKQILPIALTKQELASDTSDNEPSTIQKRGRGRPKTQKSESNVILKIVEQEDEETRDETKNGKENKDEKKREIEVIESESEEVRQLRGGRSVKRGTEELSQVNLTLHSTKHVSSEDETLEEDAQPLEKKKRGRPPKKIASNDAQQEEQEPLNAIKKVDFEEKPKDKVEEEKEETDNKKESTHVASNDDTPTPSTTTVA